MKQLSRLLSVVSAALLGVLLGPPAGAQAIVHRYSFNGGAGDSVGGAGGTVVGSVTLNASSGVNGSVDFSGGTSGSSPGFVSLPVSAVSSLQNATLEIFTTNFNPPKNQTGVAGGQYQTLFSAATPYGNPSNYINLTANYGAGGMGFSAQRNGASGTSLTARDPLPAWRQNHVVDLVFSGFTGIGTTGSVTLYLDGQPVAQTTTLDTFAALAAAPGGLSVVGIGGGSPFNDPTYSGSISEVRLFSGALSQTQIAANVAAGPAILGYTPALTVSGLTVSSLTATSATVGWSTSNAADTTVRYGPTAAYGASTSGAAGSKAHSVTLTGLTPATTYHYQAVSTDGYGQTVSTADSVFVTATPRLTTISGKVLLRGWVGAAQPLTFTLTPTGGMVGGRTLQSLTPASDGAFTLRGVTAGTYMLRVKGSRWLQRDAAVDATRGAVTGLSLTLLPGDLDGNNHVTQADYALLRDAYNSVPGRLNWNPLADLNGDGRVSLADYTLLSADYNKDGDP